MSAPAARVRRLPGEEGVWVLILGDMAVFGLFFGTLVYVRSQDPGAFRAAQAHLSQTAGALNTMLLLTASLLVARGLHAARAGRTIAAPRSFAIAMACALGFVAVKAYEYGHEIHAGLTPSAGDFWMYFFVFTGIHLLHVVIGLAVLAVLARRSRQALRDERDVRILEAGACYWHMVDLLWLVLFALLYLMA